MENTNYDYLVEIQIWRAKINDEDYYRYCPGYNSPFWKDMNISQEEKKNLEKTWKFYQKFFAFSNVYCPSLGRGYYKFYYLNNMEYPYESRTIHQFPKKDDFVEAIPVRNSYHFVVSLYGFPNMKLFYMGAMEELGYSVLRETFVWTEALEKSGEKDTYTFLPSAKNVNTPWYDIYLPPYDNHIFYVFEDYIEKPFWKLNSEDIIIPSSDPTDHASINDILKQLNKYVLKNPNTIVQTNSLPIYNIWRKDTPEYDLKAPEYTWKIFVFFFIVLLSMLLIQVFVQKKKN